MDWCVREWKGGLGLLAEKYNFAVRPYEERPEGGPASDIFLGPSGHAISAKARILWLDEGSAQCEWLHEVAHLVCTPPWEKDPDHADEFGGIFGWERAVAKEFLRRGMWTDTDYASFESVQNIYGLGDTPPEWTTKEYRTGPAEWGGVPPKHQRTVVAYINRTLRLAGLLNGNSRPTWREPTWTDEVQARWQVMSNFKDGWSKISNS